MSPVLQEEKHVLLENRSLLSLEMVATNRASQPRIRVAGKCAFASANLCLQVLTWTLAATTLLSPCRDNFFLAAALAKTGGSREKTASRASLQRQVFAAEKV